MINIEIARNYLQAGLAVLPADKVRKYPVLSGWKRYQEELPTESEVHAWFSNHHNALCIVCGKVSGNLEIIDFDNQGELFPAWLEKIPSDLKAKLVIEKTPSGGYHVAYRCNDEVCGNIKLAQGDRWVDSGYIFTQDDGSRLHPDCITDWLGKFSKKHNLPHIHPHAFRHPYVKHTTKFFACA